MDDVEVVEEAVERHGEASRDMSRRTYPLNVRCSSVADMTLSAGSIREVQKGRSSILT